MRAYPFVTHSVHVAVSGLVKVLVGDHFIFDGDENFLHGGFTVPVLQEGKLAGVELTCCLVNRGDVNFGVKLHSHGDIGILGTTDDRQEINTVVEFCVGRSNNGSIPVGERLIVSIIESIRDGTISDTLFSSFKFVK